MNNHRALRQILCFIGANAHRLRTRRGLTQEQVSRRAGLELSFYQRIERAKTNLSVAALASVADALGVPIPELLAPAKLQRVRRGRPRRTTERKVKVKTKRTPRR